MADKRITELTNEKLTLGDGDYTIVDSNEGTFKFKLKRIMDAIPAIDDSLSQEGEAADAKEVGDQIAGVKRDLNDKANIDGTYDGMTVGNAKQLLSEKYLLDEEPYLFRASGGDGSDRVEECIVGGSVGWNQLVQNGDFADTSGWAEKAGVTLSVASNKGKATVTGILDRWSGIQTSVDVIANHVLLGCATIKSSLNLSSELGFTNMPNIQSYSDNSYSVMGRAESTARVLVQMRYGANYSSYSSNDYIEISDVNMFDLTTLFGTTIADYIYSLEQATAGAGVAWFKKYFPEDYYPYSAPTLRHVEGVSAKEVVGWNQWDEEWELGILSNVDGSPSADNAHIRTKNYIPVLPNTTYYNTGYTLAVFLYDANHAFIGNANVTVGTFTTGANTHYIKFYRTATTYNHDICISLSDPTKNGVYEPYHKNIYPLDSTLTLRGIPKLTDGKMWFDGDKYNADGTVTRNTVLRAYQSGDESLANAITDGTNTVVYSANASTETATPYTALQTLDPDGTEEFVSTGIVPVGHYSKYLENLRAKIEGLPKDFSTLIAPTEKAYKATQNYTVGSLLIVDNILYKVTSAIANGGNITPNTNCTATTLAAVIAAL